MKKILTVLLVLSIGTLGFMGCSLIFGTTLSVSTDDGGWCYEITTSDLLTIMAWNALGAVEEPCNTENAVASCTFESTDYDQTMVNYYSQAYLDAATENLENECEGDWEWLD